MLLYFLLWWVHTSTLAHYFLCRRRLRGTWEKSRHVNGILQMRNYWNCSDVIDHCAHETVNNEYNPAQRAKLSWLSLRGEVNRIGLTQQLSPEHSTQTLAAEWRGGLLWMPMNYTWLTYETQYSLWTKLSATTFQTSLQFDCITSMDLDAICAERRRGNGLSLVYEQAA